MRYPAVLMLSALVAGPAHALRCGRDIVSVGDSTYDLTQRCGQPTRVERVEARTVNQPVYDSAGRSTGYMPVTVSEPYEVWTYNFGPNRFISNITVRNGRVENMEEAGYGY